VLVVDGNVMPPDRLATLARARGDLVLVEPDATVLGRLTPSLAPAGTLEPSVRPAACAEPDAAAAGSALAGGRLYRARQPAATVCFTAAEDDGGAYAVTVSGGRQVRVIGQGGVLSNEHLAQHGNAALAIRVLGHHPHLVWLMASPLDTSADREVSTTDLLPGWLPWAAAQLAVVVVLAMLWRGRRLGRLVEEPLPVVVRSAETAEGRAALYRAAGARDRAAAELRAATLRRLDARLGLPPGADGEQVLAAAARAAGRDPGAVRALLLGPPPAEDPGLVSLADDLDVLTHDVTANASRTHLSRKVPHP
jgi:hypothetical protein